MALFGLHTPTFGPLHPIIGKLPGTGLSGFTQYLLAFGDATGGLTQDTDARFENNQLLLGAEASATDFPNARLVSSKGDSGHSYTNNIGIVGESKSVVGYPGIGVGGVAETNGVFPAYGVAGRALVTASADAGGAVGVQGVSEATHAGGSNVAFWASATNGLLNYSFFGNAGNMYNLGYFHIDDKIEFTSATEYIDQETW